MLIVQWYHSTSDAMLYLEGLEANPSSDIKYQIVSVIPLWHKSEMPKCN